MATWYIINGNLPFLEEFPPMEKIDDLPNIIGRSVWRIKNGELPFKSYFPPMYKVVEEGTNLYFGNKLIKKIFFGDTKIKAVYNGDTKIF